MQDTLSEENQKKVFDRFFRVENSTHTIKGTGLGLHLVKVSVEKLHAGQVFVHSKLGEGSTFGFRLPVNPPVEKDTDNDEMPKKDLEDKVRQKSEQNNGNDGWEISFEKR